MAITQAPETLNALAPDLTQTPPRSPRETLAGYVLAARALDKCRATLNGSNGEYNFNRKLDQMFFEFTGIDADEFSAFVKTGADDAAVAEWIQKHSRVQNRQEIIQWNNQLRAMQLKDLPGPLQEFFEDYIEKHLPKHRPVYCVFDVFDIEEGRL